MKGINTHYNNNNNNNKMLCYTWSSYTFCKRWTGKHYAKQCGREHSV